MSKTIRGMLRTLGFGMLGLLAGMGPAQAFEPLFGLPITEGAWVADSRPNNGWFVDIDERGYAFIAWYTYDSLGRASWLVMQGQITVNTEAQRRSSGAIAVLRSPFFTGAGGACPTCPPTAASITPVAELGQGEFTFFDTRRGQLSYAGRTVELKAFELSVPTTDAPVGLWKMTYRSERADGVLSTPDSPTESKDVIVRVRKSPTVALHVSVPAPSPPSFLSYDFGPLPGKTAQYYSIECVQGCGDFATGSIYDPMTGIFYHRISDWVWWLENGVFRGGNAQRVNADIFPTNRQFNFHTIPSEGFVGQDRMVWRGKPAFFGPNLPPLNTFVMKFELEMTRLPETWLTRR